MHQAHQKIINELLKEYTKDKSVVAITIFGSLAKGEERPNSDVDIEIITTGTKSYMLSQKDRRYGHKIDKEIIPEKDFLVMTKKFPYLWYDYYKRHNIIYDPNGVVKNAINYLSKYYKTHPEVCEFWEQKLKEMKKSKRKNKLPESAYDVYDEAEKLFSSNHKVTRNFFRK